MPDALLCFDESGLYLLFWGGFRVNRLASPAHPRTGGEHRVVTHPAFAERTRSSSYPVGVSPASHLATMTRRRS